MVNDRRRQRTIKCNITEITNELAGFKGGNFRKKEGGEVSGREDKGKEGREGEVGTGVLVFRLSF